MVSNDDIQLQLFFVSPGALRGRIPLLPSRIIAKQMHANSSQLRQEMYAFYGDFHVSAFFSYHLHKLPHKDRKPWSGTLQEYQRQVSGLTFFRQ